MRTGKPYRFTVQRFKRLIKIYSTVLTVPVPKMWARSSAGERLLCKEEARGSIPCESIHTAWCAENKYAHTTRVSNPRHRHTNTSQYPIHHLTSHVHTQAETPCFHYLPHPDDNHGVILPLVDGRCRHHRHAPVSLHDCSQVTVVNPLTNDLT